MICLSRGMVTVIFADHYNQQDTWKVPTRVVNAFLRPALKVFRK